MLAFKSQRLSCATSVRDTFCESCAISGMHGQTVLTNFQDPALARLQRGAEELRAGPIWFDPGMIWAAKPTGKPGRHPVYTDAAIQTCLRMKDPFGLALRQVTGCFESQLFSAWTGAYRISARPLVARRPLP